MSKKGLGALILLASFILLVACAPASPAAAPTAAGKTTSTPGAAGSPAAKAGDAGSQSGALDQLVEGARKESVLRVNMPSTLTDKGLREMVDAFNKKYSLNISADYTPSTNYPAAIAQVITELKAGSAPSWDFITGTPMSMSTIAVQGLITKYDWQKAFPEIPAKAINFDGASLDFATAYYSPAFNTKLLKPEDAPRGWEDLTDPKWKGKLVLMNLPTVWVMLTETWGEARVTALVEGLARNQPLIAQTPQMVPRVLSGEFPILVNATSSNVLKPIADGAPLRYAEVKPTPGDAYLFAVPKNAKVPNAALLFEGFQLSPEAQQIWWKYTQRGSSWMPGPARDDLKGKELIFNTIEFLEKEGPRLSEKYGKILGLN